MKLKGGEEASKSGGRTHKFSKRTGEEASKTGGGTHKGAEQARRRRDEAGYLSRNETRVDPVGFHEVVVGPLLNEPPLVHHRDVVRVHNRGQPARFEASGDGKRALVSE